MKTNEILVGFDRTGGAVSVRPSHLIVTGLTQLSGKSTTLEALIKRSGLRAIAFKTKRGEQSFTEGTVIRPLFRSNSDWQYVSSLLEATMQERMKFERAWIIKACKGARTLNEVYENCKTLRDSSRESSLQNSIYTTLIAYFELVLPQLRLIEFSNELKLKDGINIMELEHMSSEVQSLVIRSTLEWVLENETDTVLVIPEAWKFLPQARGNPVKVKAEEFIRQGATNRNFLWIDSQDMAGVDKTALKQIANWILGLQTERNEVEHTLDQIPLPNSAKPPTEDIMRLHIGQFFVCNPEFTKLVYVQPAWLDEETAKRVAMGEIPVEAVMNRKKVNLKRADKFDEVALSNTRKMLETKTEQYAKIEKENALLKEQLAKCRANVKNSPDIKKRYNKLLENIKKMAQWKYEEEVPLDATSAVGLTRESMLPKEFEVITPIIGRGSTSYDRCEAVSIEPYTHASSVPLEQNALLSKVNGMAKKLYMTLAQFPGGLTKERLGLLAGAAYTGGTFRNSISKLKCIGLIKKEGDVWRVV